MIDYRNAEQKDVAQIAEVHIDCFPTYFISSLGFEMVMRYYEEYLNENDPFILAIDENRIIGFCMGYIFGQTKARQNFIKNNRNNLISVLAKKCLTLNKQVISKCISFIFAKIKKENPSIEKQGGDLLSICVLDKYRGSGVAKELVSRFENELIKRGVNGYWLGVYKSNKQAIKFYEKNGMTIEMEDRDEYKFHKKFEEYQL